MRGSGWGCESAMVLAVIAAVSAGPASSADTENGVWHLGYAVSIAGVPLLYAEATLDQRGKRYRMEATAAAPWPFDNVLPWHATAGANGLIGEEGLQPLAYRALSHWAGSDRGVALAYENGVVSTVDYTPADSAADRTLVPEDLRRGAADPLSGLLGVFRTMAAGAPCSGTVPVYDGRRRYDLEFTPITPAAETVPDGIDVTRAVPCRLGFRTLAGARTEERSRFWQTGDGGGNRPPLILWVAPVAEGGPLAPVHATTESVMGSIVITLEAAHRTVDVADGEPTRP